MLIPSDTANPLNSFLNWGLILKLSDSFSLPNGLRSPLPSVRLLVKACPLKRHMTTASRATLARIQISTFLAIQKDRKRSIRKGRNKEFWIENLPEQNGLSLYPKRMTAIQVLLRLPRCGAVRRLPAHHVECLDK